MEVLLVLILLLIYEFCPSKTSTKKTVKPKRPCETVNELSTYEKYKKYLEQSKIDQEVLNKRCSESLRGR